MGNKKTLRELFHDIKVNHLSIEDQITQTDPDLILLVCVTANAPECQDLLTFLKVAYWEWEPEPCKTIVIVCNLETDKCTYREEIMMSLAAEEWIIIQNFEDSSAVYECVYDHNDPGVPRMITLKQNLETIDNRADKTLLSSLDHSAVLRMWLPICLLLSLVNTLEYLRLLKIRIWKFSWTLTASHSKNKTDTES